MSFAEFEKEVKLQNKVMAVTRVYLKDEEPKHTFGCIYRLWDRVLEKGETIVTGLGYCGCKGFEANAGFKDRTPQIPGGFGLFLTKGSTQQWTPDGERFKCSEECAYGLWEGLPKNVMDDGKGGTFDGIKFEPYREGLECDVVVCFCNPDQLSAVIVLHGYDKPEFDRVIATTAAGCASMTRIPFGELRREKPRAVITGSDLAQRKFRDENEISIAIPAGDFAYMMSVTEECFFHAPVWKPIRNRLRKDEKLQDACFTALGTVE